MDLNEEVFIMTITATEFKLNLGKYLDMVDKEEIIITKNGKSIARLSKPESEKIALLDSLVGVAKNVNIDDLDTIRTERLARQ
jgi:prevent-host-death family protein